MAVLAFLGYAPTPFVLAAEMTADEAVVTEPISSVEATEGTISMIDLEAEKPYLKLKAADAAAEPTVYLDFESTTVWQGDEELILEDLVTDQKVKIRQVGKDGQKVAKTIEIL